MTRTKSLLTLDRELLWHPYSPLVGPDPLLVTRAEQEFLWIGEDRKIIDLISSWWVNLHGHAHPYIAERLNGQFKTIDHVLFAGFTHAAGIELAERLLRHLPGQQSRLFFSDNGSTAVEVALKMAIQYWHLLGQERKTIAVLTDSYHGDTVGAMSVSARGIFTAPFKHLLFDVLVLPRPEKESGKFLQLMEQACETQSLAAFIYEPLIQGAAGMKFLDRDSLEAGIRLCKQAGVLCIADEVMTGFGRTGQWFASDYLSSPPDLVCLSKGITGGVMPFGATSCSAQVAEIFHSEDRAKTFFHGHSYTGNPLACAAALASLDLLEKPETWQKIECIGRQYQGLIARLAEFPILTNLRALGTVFACEFINKSPGYLSEIGPKLYNFFLKRDLLIRPLGNSVYLMPPYCVSSQSLETAFQALEEAAQSKEITQ